MMITYTQHPRFEFDILVDLYADGSTSLPLMITNVARKLIGAECIAKIEGYVTADAPIDACSARLVDKDEHLAEVAREAHKRNIKDVSVRCKYRILLTNDDWGRVERDGFNTRDVSYVITLLGYTTVDDIVVEFDRIHELVFEGHLQRQVHASLLSKCNELRPTSTVTTRRI